MRPDQTVPATHVELDRAALVERFRRLRSRSRQLFDMLDPDLYYTRPIALRNPIVFYEGHLPGFAINTLIKKGLGRPGIDERLERIFARGIDPDSEVTAHARHGEGWPDRREVQAFVAAADAMLEDALQNAPLARAGVPVLDRAEGVFTILEHEALHQETLLYMWHRLPHERKRRPAERRWGQDEFRAERDAKERRWGRDEFRAERDAKERRWGRDEFRAERDAKFIPTPFDRVRVPAGRVTLGARRDAIVFGWDNEFPEHQAGVDVFDVDRHPVSNAEYLEFVEAGGYGDERWWSREAREWTASHHVRHPLFWERRDGAWFWRGQFEYVPLPADWPVYVSHAEAEAFARWRGGRLMSEAEYHRAAFGGPDGERAFPWGGEAPPEAAGPEPQVETAPQAASRGPQGAYGCFDFQTWDPVPNGSRPRGQSAWGIHDLIGNGWEWTASAFAPFDGFVPMPSYPEYSAEFFDGQHYVLKGASPVTDGLLIRRSLRNWFRPMYPYVYAKFRCAYDAT